MAWDTKKTATLCLSCVLSLVLVTPAVAAERSTRWPKADSAAVQSLDVHATDADDAIPGIPAPASPIAGSLDENTTDYADFYSINLVAGQHLHANIMADPGTTNFNLYLYAPDGTTIVKRADSPTYPELLRYTAAATGTYYLVSFAAYGAGSYSIPYRIFDADSDIPGVAVPASPISGTLDQIIDPDDVFSMSLIAGQDLEVSLTGDAGTDFELYLFGPGSTTLYGDPYLINTSSDTYPKSLNFIVPDTGTYYLDTLAFSGSGGYTVSVTELVKPVVTCSASAGYVGSASISITAADTGGSGVSSITYQLDGGAAATVGGSSATAFTNVLGPHTLTATALDGAGNTSEMVTTSFNLIDETTLALAPPSAMPAYGAAATLSATLKRATLGVPAPGQTVVFERQSGTSWVSVGTAVTDANGIAAISTVPYARAKTVYRARFDGAGVYINSWSGNVVVTPKVSITKPNAPTTMIKGRTAAVSGYLRPRHAAGSYPVKIYKYRLVGSTWRSYGFVKAKAANYSTYTKYSKSLSLPYKGKWRLRAYAPADSKHVATWSSFDYVTVK